MRTSVLRAVALLTLPGLFLPGLVGAATFTLLGTLPDGPGSTPFAVSADGLVAAGVSDSVDGSQAFRWTDGVMTGLGTLEGDLGSSASGASGDGAVVVGSSAGEAGSQAFRWTGGVMTGLGTLEGDSSSSASDVSSDGAVVVGTSTNDTGTQAFRWTGGVMTGLGTLEGDSSSSAQAVSADGAVVVGGSERVTGLDDQGEPITAGQAFSWTGGVMTGLGTLEGDASSIASDVSADGSVVVGHSDLDDGTPQAFSWTGGVMTGLGFLPDSDNSTANAVSGDGSVVVGQSGGRAFIWTAATGMQPLVSVLIAGGATGLDFATLYNATDISADGLTVVGIRGSAAFIATYSPEDLDRVPDPFAFEGQTGVAPSTEVTSGPVTITGITNDAEAPVTVYGGEYSVGCGAADYTSDPGIIVEGDTVCVRQTSAATGATNQNTILTVGGVSGWFTSRTSGSSGGNPSSSGMDGLSLLALGLFGLLRRKSIR